jgi:hypothetical protein
MHGRLHERQQVLGAVVYFARKQLDQLLPALSLGDVARDFRRADDPAIGVLDRRNRERDVDQAAVLAPANGFVVIDALAAPDASENPALLGLAVRWNQDRDGLCRRLRRRNSRTTAPPLDSR